MTKKPLYSLRRLAYRILAGFDKLFGRENSAVILVFHSVDNSNWFFGNTQAQIEAYLQELSKHYKIISLSEMLNVIERKKHFPVKVAALTFDDGYKNLLTVAPLFKQYGIKPTVFALSNPKQANRVELETHHELLNESELLILCKVFGWEVGSHTATHENLSNQNLRELQKQIGESRKKIGQLLQEDIKFFAYPKGIYSETIVQHVKKAGYKAAFTMDHCEVKFLGDLHKIPRVGINRTHSVSETVDSTSPSVIQFKKVISLIFKNFKIW